MFERQHKYDTLFEVFFESAKCVCVSKCVESATREVRSYVFFASVQAQAQLRFLYHFQWSSNFFYHLGSCIGLYNPNEFSLISYSYISCWTESEMYFWNLFSTDVSFL